MTQKDYIAIAAIIKSERKDYADGPSGAVGDALDHITVELADYMQRDNPRFKRDLFYKAAGHAV